MINKNSLMYGAVILTFTNIFSQILGFIYRIILSRMIGAEGMGLFQLISPVYSVIMSIAVSGFTVAVSRLSAEYRALSNINAVRRLISFCMILFLAVFISLAIPALIFSDGISVLLGDARTQLSLLILLPCILFTGFENIHKNYFYGTGNILPAAITEIVEQIVRITAVITLLWIFLPQTQEITVGLIFCGMVICEIVSSAMLIRFYRKNIKSLGFRGTGEKTAPLFKKIMKIAVPIAGTNLLANLMGSVNAVMIPQRLVASGMSVSASLSSFGVMFGMAFPLLSLPSAFVIALSLVMVPRLSESLALKDYIDLRRKISKALFVTSILIFPAAAFMITLGKTAGVYLFKNPSVGDYLIPLSIGLVLSSFQAILGSILNGLGKQKYTAINYITGGVLQLFFTYFGTAIPGIGLYGFVAGHIISTVVTGTLNAVCVAVTVKLRLDLSRLFIGPGLSAVFAGLTMKFTHNYTAHIPGGLFISAAAGIIIYLFALKFQKVNVKSLLPGH